MRAISDQVEAVMLSPALAACSSARLAFSFHSAASLSSVTACSTLETPQQMLSSENHLVVDGGEHEDA